MSGKMVMISTRIETNESFRGLDLDLSFPGLDGPTYFLAKWDQSFLTRRISNHEHIRATGYQHVIDDAQIAFSAIRHSASHELVVIKTVSRQRRQLGLGNSNLDPGQLLCPTDVRNTTKLDNRSPSLLADAFDMKHNDRFVVSFDEYPRKIAKPLREIGKGIHEHFAPSSMRPSHFTNSDQV
jgi:hypothetical protein